MLRALCVHLNMANFFMDATHQKETYKFMDVPQLLFPRGT